eukprot:EG_transcript_27701
MADNGDSGAEFPGAFSFGGETAEDGASPVEGATEEGAEAYGTEEQIAGGDAANTAEAGEVAPGETQEGGQDGATEGNAVPEDDGMYGFGAPEGEPSTTVCIANLPSTVEAVHFRLLFRFAKGVDKCIVVPTPAGQLVGYARFLTLEDAQAAIEALDGKPADEDLPGQLQASLAPRQLGEHPQPALKRPHDHSWESSPAKAGGKGGWGGGGDWSGGGGAAAGGGGAMGG